MRYDSLRDKGSDIRNAENLDKSRLSAEFLASQRGFEPPTPRLGVRRTIS